MPHKVQGSDSYHFNIRIKGKRYRGSLETSSLTEAKKREALIKARIIEGRWNQKEPGSDITFGVLVEHFMARHAPKRAASTQESYKSSLKSLMPFFSGRLIGEITDMEVKEYIDMRRVQKARNKETVIKGCSINREIAMLSTMYSFAIERCKWVKVNPARKMEKEPEEPRERWLEAKEAQDAVQACYTHGGVDMGDFVVVDMHTGFRRETLLSLTWRNVHLAKRRISTKSKGKKLISIPISDSLYELLVKRANDNRGKTNNPGQLVFHKTDGGKYNGDVFLKKYKKCLAKAGLRNVTIHDLRRTFGSWAAQNNVSSRKLAEWFGHVDTRMVEKHYAHLNVESLATVSAAAQVGHILATVESERDKLNNTNS